MHDLVIRGGTIVDGSGAPRFTGDVAIDGGKITAVGRDVGRGRREIDADGALVTPGWVDLHTHYDAQVTWDPMVSPSSWHGVTTVVMGNCGVGFAPAAPSDEDHRWLIGLMEGVEDIPGTAMTEGMKWEWESFPGYLDAVDRRRRAIDVAAQVPHGALRAYVMGDRGGKHERATPEDLSRMSALVEEGIRAGAVGVSTSRTFLHKGMDGEYVPGTLAEEEELFALGEALRRVGRGVFQMTSNHVDMPKEFVWMRRMTKELGVPVTFNLVQPDEAPDLWRDMLGLLDGAAAEGLPLWAQVAGRPTGILMNWRLTAHPFVPYASYMEVMGLPIEDRVRELAKPERKARILAEEPFHVGDFENWVIKSFHKMYRLGTEPEYEPDPSQSAAAIAERTGRNPKEIAYDWLMEDGGNGFLYFPIFNYAQGNMDHLLPLHRHPRTRLGLGDGGAHCGAVCDASIQTYMLTHWVRDRAREGRMGLEEVVHGQTGATAEMYGFMDRGLLKPGYKADVNVIDFSGLRLRAPEVVYDLPTDARRLVQRADGYLATIVSGETILEKGTPTGALPGKLIRGGR